VAVLTVNNPPVNALSQHVRQGLRDGLKQAAADSAVSAIVIVCAARSSPAPTSRSSVSLRRRPGCTRCST
jgi:hypothetical protein